jgi:hypothetical protein
MRCWSWSLFGYREISAVVQQQQPSSELTFILSIGAVFANYLPIYSACCSCYSVH